MKFNESAEPHEHASQYERQLCIARGLHYDDRLEFHSSDGIANQVAPPKGAP